MLVVNYTSAIILVLLAISNPWFILLYLLLYAGFLIYLHWDQYTMGLEMIETRLWGKPLNFYKESGERRPKLKFVWNKKTYGEKKE